MSRSLEARIAKLEQRSNPERVISAIIESIYPIEGELYGYRNDPYEPERVDTIRQPGESDAELLARAISSARTVGRVPSFLELRH